MRQGYQIIDTENPNFLVQKGLEGLKDVDGNRIGICDMSGKGPIRAVIHFNTGKITKILCGSKLECKKKCPFGTITEIDRTDFKEHLI